MRRSVVLIALLMFVFACRQEKQAQPSRAPQQSPPLPTSSTALTATSTSAFPKPAARSTPDRCAGDGSYSQAVDCYRQTSRIDFTFEEPTRIRAEGEMSRPTIGAERLRFRLAGSGADDGEWSAEARASGVVWSRDGKRVNSTPPTADRLWQLTTLYIDPQKKEREAQRTGTERIGAEDCIRYHFTDANSSAAQDVWVSTTDGHVVAMKRESRGAFASYSLTVRKMGK
jgi:hypothetical protein